MRAMGGIGDQRHDIVQEGAAFLDPLVDLDEMLVVDAGNHHGIDLGENAARGQHLEAEHLALVQNLRSFELRVALSLVEYPRIDLRPDLGIDHIDGDRHMVDVHRREFVDAVGQHQAVGGDAELDVGNVGRDILERRPGLVPVVTGVAGARDSKYGKLRHFVGDGDDLACRLVGRQLFGDDARPALVGAIVFAVAVVALDVARGRDRHMHAREIMVRLFGIAGMILDLLPGRLVHVAGLGGGAAGRGRAAAVGELRAHGIEIDGLKQTVD